MPSTHPSIGAPYLPHLSALPISKEGEELAALFITAGVDLNSNRTSRETPLQLATLYELPNLVKLLLEKRANPFLAMQGTFTAVATAEKRENQELTKILRDKEKELDAWEVSMSDEAEKQSKSHSSSVHRNLPPILDIPGRAQAALFIRESHRLASERVERTDILLCLMVNEAFAKEVETREKYASQQSSESSNERDPPGHVHLTQQQSTGEAAKTSEAPQVTGSPSISHSSCNNLTRTISLYPRLHLRQSQPCPYKHFAECIFDLVGQAGNQLTASHDDDDVAVAYKICQFNHRLPHWVSRIPLSHNRGLPLYVPSQHIILFFFFNPTSFLQ